MNDFIFSVVKAKRIPSGMFASIAGVEILLWIAGEIA